MVESSNNFVRRTEEREEGGRVRRKRRLSFLLGVGVASWWNVTPHGSGVCCLPKCWRQELSRCSNPLSAKHLPLSAVTALAIADIVKPCWALQCWDVKDTRAD